MDQSVHKAGGERGARTVVALPIRPATRKEPTHDPTCDKVSP